MNDLDPWMRVILAVLATWRVTHLLASEDGPFDLVARFRTWVGNGFAGKLLDCFYCLSLWVASVPAFLLNRSLIDLFLTWLGLSAGACLLERVGQEPVLIKPLLQATEVESYGMLRTETNSISGDLYNSSDQPNAHGIDAGGRA